MIDRDLAAFVEEGLAIHIGTRDARLQPNGARVTAVRVDEDGRHLTVYLPTVAAPRVLPDLQANGRAALVFVRPPDDRSCQVKGSFAGVRDATADEHAFARAQWDRFLANLEFIGIPRAACAAWRMWPCVAIRVRAEALFNQTPGPGAGGPLR